MTYHLCSATVLEHLKPAEVSRPFRLGYESDTALYYVACFDGDDASQYFDTVIEPYNNNSRSGNIDFWYHPCAPGSMDVSGITLKACQELGLFRAIERALDLALLKNRALCIYNLAEQFNCNPIEFINKVSTDEPVSTGNLTLMADLVSREPSFPLKPRQASQYTERGGEEGVESDSDLEKRTDYNMNLVSQFLEHLKEEADLDVPEQHVLSFFNA